MSATPNRSKLTRARVAALQGAAAGAVLGIFAQAGSLGAGILLCAAVLALLAYGLEADHQRQLARISALEAQLPKKDRHPST